MRVIASSAALKYAKLESQDEPEQRGRAYGRLYLQKIVQIEFDVPPATQSGVQRMLQEEAESDPALVGAPGTPAPRRQERYETALGIVWLAVGVGVGLYFALRPPEGQDRASAFISGFFASAFVLLFVVAFVRWLYRLARWGVDTIQSWRAQRRLQAIDDRISRAVTRLSAGSAVGYESVADEVKGQQGLEVDEQRLVEDRVARYLTYDSPLADEAETSIEFLPLIPRSAKRMMNHLRLWLYVAIRRGLLDPGSELTPRHVGKWVVFEERWPDIAREAVDRPAILASLEQEGDADQLAQALGKLELDADQASDLFVFLGTEPRLGPLAERLITLEPASG
jgi:hypothetical protein